MQGSVHCKPCSYNCPCNIGHRAWVECASCEPTEFDTHTSDNETMSLKQRARETAFARLVPSKRMPPVIKRGGNYCGDPTCGPGADGLCGACRTAPASKIPGRVVCILLSLGGLCAVISIGIRMWLGP